MNFYLFTRRRGAVSVHIARWTYKGRGDGLINKIERVRITPHLVSFPKDLFQTIPDRQVVTVPTLVPSFILL